MAATPNNTLGVQEVQVIYINSAMTNDVPFVLNFDGVDTGRTFSPPIFKS